MRRSFRQAIGPGRLSLHELGVTRRTFASRKHRRDNESPSANRRMTELRGMRIL